MQSFKRKLTAILSADVKGYSRLMGEDEDATVRTLTAYREAIASLIQQHRGRVVDVPGDNVLAEFASVVDGLRCAWDVQQEIKARNDNLPEDRRMNFRIGVNLGDVIEEGERIYGDGVNIAARLEGLAEEGGICLSGTAYDQVKNKLPFRYEYHGEQTVKNIKEPVRVYRVVMKAEAAAKIYPETRAGLGRWRWAALAVAAVLFVAAGALAIRDFLLPHSPPSVKKASEVIGGLALPDKPSIAILPFANLSNDSQQEYFSDGITNDIITDLSKFRELFVIASNTVFTYKGKPINVKDVGRGLGVKYVLEGSVQRASDKVRVNAQLIDATTGHHLWAERYDRALQDLFAVQDEIVQSIVTTLGVKIDKAERARAIRKDTESLEAYDYVLRGSEYLSRYTRSANLKARQMFEKAIALDPEYANAYVALGWSYYTDADYGWTEFPDRALQQAYDYAQKSLSLDEYNSSAHRLFGQVYIRLTQYDLAISELQQAIELNPNDARSYSSLGFVMLYEGRTDEAIQSLETALRFDRNISPGTSMELGIAYYLKGRYDDAVNVLHQGLSRKPDFMGIHIALAATYAQMGRSVDARSAAQEALRLYPFFELDSYGTAFRNREDREKIVDGLRKAGLK
jgi:adenylate cyclase